MEVIASTERHGRKYRMYRDGDQHILRIGSGQHAQSMTDGGALYYGEMAAAVPMHARTVLILGLGGGTAARAIRARFAEAGRPQPFVVGVDCDPVVLSMSRAVYGESLGCDVVKQCDAREVDLQGLTFDAVLVDCYLDATVKVDVRGSKHVAPGGVVIENEYDGRENTVTVKHF